MKMTRILIPLATILLLLLAGCASEKEVPAIEEAKSSKLQIVATLFPQYDFARQIAGDKAEVLLLLPPGVESHSYEPTPSDIIKINHSDLFLYTGKNMEAWSQKIIEGMTNVESHSVVLDVSKGIELAKTSDIEAEYEQENEHEHEQENEHFCDPHIWTDPIFAKVMVANIKEALCELDPANADYYKENAAKYNSELDTLDIEFKTIAQSGKRNEIIFGSRFALYYFAKQYGLNYEAAFDSCSSETEPSAKTVAKLIKKIKQEQIPVIYYAEIEEPTVAKSISEETGAKMLLFHSCHNI
ncbi:MAG: metal ABC transporter substrate-binding protein, partial [Bacillota bacterium]